MQKFFEKQTRLHKLFIDTPTKNILENVQAEKQLYETTGIRFQVNSTLALTFCLLLIAPSIKLNIFIVFAQQISWHDNQKSGITLLVIKTCKIKVFSHLIKYKLEICV